MPTYVYKFVESGETIEVHQNFHDETLTEIVHPDTGEPLAVKKVFTPVGVTFKGSGFFKTDNRGKKASSTSTGGSSGGDAKGGDAKSEKSSGSEGGSSGASTSSGSASGSSSSSDSGGSSSGSKDSGSKRSGSGGSGSSSTT